MTFNRFIWTDLSTFDLRAARREYSALFGWNFTGDNSYDFASASSPGAVSAVFPMPEKLAKLGLPSFWMNYIHVADVDATVEKARQHESVIIEVKPEAFGESARIALIRDPAGAGFTIYEGPEITPDNAGQPGAVARRFHHLPDVGLIRDFYSDLFGWRFEPADGAAWPVYDILHEDGGHLASVEEVPETIRGKFRYWMPCFAVSSLEQAAETLTANGGKLFADLGGDAATGSRLMAEDSQGASFMLCVPAANNSATDAGAGTGADPTFRLYTADDRHGSRSSGKPSQSALKTSAEPAEEKTVNTYSSSFPRMAAVGLICVWLAVVLGLPLFWGVLFLLWALPALRTGRADFIQPVFRDRTPVLFWLLTGTWILLSLYMIIWDILLLSGVLAASQGLT